MKSLALGLCAIVAAFTLNGCVQAVPKTVDAGIVVSASSDFINEYKNAFNIEFLKRI